MTTRAVEAPRRSSYLSEVVDPAPDRHSVLSLHSFVGAYSGGSDAIVEKPLLTVQFLNLQTIDTPQEERTQYYMNTVDAGKIILFGRAPRVYSFSGFLYDSDLDEGQGLSLTRSASAADVAYNGRFLSRWNDLYETKFRFTKCLKNRQIVRIRWRDNEVYGYLISNIKSLNSNTPSMASVSFTFVVLVEAVSADIPLVSIGEGTVPATMSWEGWRQVLSRRNPLQPVSGESEMSKEIGDRTRMPR